LAAISCIKDHNIPKETVEYEEIVDGTADDLYMQNQDDDWDAFDTMMQNVERYRMDIEDESDVDTIREDWNEANHVILFHHSSEAIENLVTLFTSLYGSFKENVLDALREHLKRLADLIEKTNTGTLYITTKDIKNFFQEFFMKTNDISMDLFVLGELMTTDETFASYSTTDNMYVTYHLIIAKNSDDIAAALENTLHRLIEAGKEDDILEIMGAVKAEPEEESISIDLGYVIPGSILSFKKMCCEKDIL
ncbi:hypothetical protein, partial [Blautia sp.]|uniref:hypothetical protein n=1 Tax=Blautia sp. TaxID=1955243 RepID=UPI003AB6A376